MKKFKLSIIIPTWNRKKKLIILINSITKKLNKFNINYEINICDSYSRDGSEIAIKKLFKNYRCINFYNINENNISKKRNFGIKKSLYPNILLLDDDCIPIKNFFFILKKYLINSKGKEIFFGQYYTQPKLLLNSNYYKFRDLKNLKTNKLINLNYNNVVTGCCFFKGNLIKKKIYFNDKIKGYGLEDIEWAHRLKNKKFKLLLSEAKVDHQETSRNISAYVIKWYMLSKDAMPSILSNKKIKMKGKIFLFESIFANFFFRYFLKFLNYFFIKPFSIMLKFILLKTDNQKYLFSSTAFNILLFLYYLRGACDRKIKTKQKWYDAGYK